MNPSLTEPDRARHLLSSETRPRMAKADLRKSETEGWRVEIGRAIQRAMGLAGWNLEQFANAVGRDARQCSRWINGAERPQMDALFAVERLRPALVIALSELAGEDVTINTVVTIRRKAVA